MVAGKETRGPQSVEKSLRNGLEELGYPYLLNTRPKKAGVVGVLSGVNMLKQALAWKQGGLITKIIAGPNLVVGPFDYNRIVQNPLIDLFLVPSQWTRDLYATLAPTMEPKLRIWAAGVDFPELASRPKKFDFLIYNKLGKNKIFFDVKNILDSKNFSYQIFNYGKFGQKDYFAALEQSRFLIYLSASESQGLAMFEAWARGVPALVWERGFFKNGAYYLEGKTGGPYVTDENGMSFNGLKDFFEVVDEFTTSVFNPRAFIAKNFTFRQSAQNYLKIYNELK